MPCIQQVQNKTCDWLWWFDTYVSDTQYWADLLRRKSAIKLQCHHNPHANEKLKHGPQLCHLTSLRKDTYKKSQLTLQTLLRKARRIDLISFLVRKRKCDKPSHQGKSVLSNTQDKQDVSFSFVTGKPQINKKSWWENKATRKTVVYWHHVGWKMELSSIITTDLP